MPSADRSIQDVSSAKDVADTYEVAPGVYILGSLSTGVTVYRQQVRAHNLSSALHRLASAGEISINQVAVIGGGIAGLTVACALLVLDPRIHITLFEKRWDLCPLQQGCDTRWLHPTIYDWPATGSTSTESDLPILDWRAGRASDVAARILKRFADHCAWKGNPNSETTLTQERIRIVIGLSHLIINAANRSVEWMGHLAERQGGYFRAKNPEGDTRRFDVIIAATGFGLELAEEIEQVNLSASYWRSDMLGQPALAGTMNTYIVSGYGDGAIVDLCRLKIERFRQDNILEELFGPHQIDDLADHMQALISASPADSTFNLKSLIENNEPLFSQVKNAVDQLSHRVRKDTVVILHARGTGDSPRSIEKLFSSKTSLANRLMLYMLYRAGAFLVRFEEIDSVTREFGVPATNIVQRHGTASKKGVLDLFSDSDTLIAKLDTMQKRDDQSARPLYPLGSFQKIPEGDAK